MKKLILKEVRHAIQEAEIEASASIVNQSIIQQNIDDVLEFGDQQYPCFQKEEAEKVARSFILTSSSSNISIE